MALSHRDPAPDLTPAAAPAGAAPSSSTRRLGGLDAARAVAIVGMVMVHIGPRELDTSTPLGLAYRSSYGRASVLFVVLAGLGVSLLAGDRSAARTTDATRRLLFRAAVLFPVGLALQRLPHGVAVILQYYAVWFLVAAAAVRLPDRWLLGLAAAGAGLMPVLLVALQLDAPGWFAGGGRAGIGEPVRLLRALLVVGYYPTVTWLPPLLLGMWLGRQDLRALRRGWWLVGFGGAAAAAAYGTSEALVALLGRPDPERVGWAWLIRADGHSEMPLSLVGATGVAVLLIGVMLLLVRALPRLTWPLVATGQLALSVYVLHLFVLAAAAELLRRDEVAAAFLSVGRFAVVTVALCALWRWPFSRGPLEWLLHLPFRRRPSLPA